jgi:hypothetical protein
MDTSDFELYKGKTFASLCKDIVTNSEEKKQQLDILITDLREMIKTVNDAVTVVPLLKEYFDVGVRNDEQLIKLAAIIQRMISGRAGVEGEGGNSMLTDEEKKQLMTVIEETAKKVNVQENTKDNRA